jgi:protein-L-isoaspartate(D-aspartate) O-methyltransferase
MAMNTKLESARRQMVEQQVRTWDVLEPRVLETLSVVPREQFVPEIYRGVAFADTEIPIGHGQFMLKPAIEGRILQALAPARGEHVLEIGTGTGFFAACLAHLTGVVESIEIHGDLAAKAAQVIDAQGIRRVHIETADALGREYEPRYQVVAVTGSLPVYDRRFERALTIGGRLFIVVGSAPVMEARLVIRTGENSWLTESLFETSIESLEHATAAPRFRF